MKDNLKYIGNNIRTARQNKKLTIELLAELAGISESFLGTVERGESSLSIETLIGICKALNVSADSIIMRNPREQYPNTEEIITKPSATFKDRINILWEEAKDQNYKLTQKEFAQNLGATRSQLQGWLNGAGEPDSEMLKVIAQTHNSSIDWLLGNTNLRYAIKDDAFTDEYTKKIKKLPLEVQKTIDLIIDLHEFKEKSTGK
ncbi:MAG: XRE family transcriptional regulator [Sporomusaceae bacterium]|jgi:transcriptional regulator with XRE-family HTH domain|nr:XRE family transcriptional regulator [Sporomusaceae bacterium]